MDNNKVKRNLRIFGVVLCVACLVGGIYSFVHPVTSGPTIDQQNEVNHIK